MRRRTILGLAPLLSFVLAPASAGAGALVLSPTADAWIEARFPGANHGTDATLALLRSGGDERRALLRFDVSSLPTDVVVTEAYLTFRVTDTEPNSFPVEVMPALAAWSEGTVTWANGVFLHDSTTVVGGFVPWKSGDIRCDVTSIVRDWVAGTRPAFGLVLRAVAGSDTSSVASREAFSAPARPTLVIATAAPVTDTAYRVATGTYVGTGVAGLVISGLGFTPDVVLVRGVPGAREAVVRTSTMTGDRTKGLESKATTFANGITSLDADGFTVGTDARVNSSAATYSWTAFRTDPARLAVGSYVGNGVDGRAIPVGFAPRYAVVLGQNDDVAMQRFTAQATGESVPFTHDSEKTDRIQNFLSSGLDVGTHKSVNQTGESYHWAAWIAASHVTTEGTYVGNDNDNRNITGLGFSPEVVFVKTQQSKGGAFRPVAIVGDVSLPFMATATYADGIQALLADGFQVGRRHEVNEGGKSIYWAAFRKPDFADLAVFASVSDKEPAEADSISWTVVVRNEGPKAASSVVVTELVPQGLTYLAHGQSRGTYAAATGSWLVGTLAAGDSAQLVVGTRVDEGTAGTHIVDWVDVTGSDQPDSVHANQADSVAIHVIPKASVDLGVTKTVDQPAPNVGELVHFTISVKNYGELDATGVLVSDALPAGLTYRWSLPSRGTYAPGSGHWSVGKLDTGSSASLQLAATVDLGTEGQTLVNVAAVTTSGQGDGDPSNDADSAIVVISSADLRVSLAVDDPNPSEGDVVTFSVDVVNDGPSGATGVVLIDELPTGLGFVSAVPSVGSYDDATGKWSIGGLAAGNGATLQLVAAVDSGTAAQSITNVASVASSDQPDPDPTDDAASQEILVQSARLAVTTAVDDAAPREGDVVRLEVIVQSAGPNDASSVQLADALTAGLSWISDSATAGAYDEGTGAWDVGPLAAGAAESLSVFASVDAGTGGLTLVNVASLVASLPGDPDPADDADSVAVVVQSADLSVTKTPSIPFANEGDTVLWTVAVTNEGPFDAASVAVQDNLPAGLTWLADVPSQGSYDHVAGLWTVGALAAHDAATLAMLTRVGAGTADTKIANVATSLGSDLPDPNGSNDAWTAELRVRAADLTLTKTVNRPTTEVGQTITYTVTVSNAGPDSAISVAVTDSLPAGVTYSAHSVNHGAYDPASGLWSIGTLADSSSARLSLSATVNGGTQGQTIRNIARVSDVEEADPSPGAEADTATVNVTMILPIWLADLEIAKSVDVPAPREGDPVQFSVQVTNQGPDGTTGVEVTDLVPAGLQFVSAATTRGSYAPATGRWAIGPLAASETVTLALDATVAPGTAGHTIVNHAAITASDFPDPAVSGGAADSVQVQAADLAVNAVVDDPTPDEADVVTYTIQVTNAGPDPAAGIVVSSLLPPSLAFLSASPTQGAFTDSTGAWNVGALASGNFATLALAATVSAGTAGATIVHAASLAASDQGDPSPGNDSSSVSVTVRAADIALAKSVDDATPAEADTVLFTIEAKNLGPDDATGLVVTDPLPAGLAYDADSASAGSYDSGTGAWTIGTLDVGTTATLALAAVVASGTSPNAIANVAARASADVADPSASNDAASAVVSILPFSGIYVSALQDSGAALPGDVDARLMTVSLANSATSMVRLESLLFHNTTVGPGTPVQLDADFGPAILYRDDGDLVFEPARDVPLGAAVMSGDHLAFAGFSVGIPPGAIATFHVGGGPSFSARDGDVLDLMIEASSDVVFDVPTSFATTFPVDPPGGVPVDGAVSAQVDVRPVPDSDVAQGAARVLAFDVGIPSNGYEADVVHELHLQNLGDAIAADLTGLEFWADGGDDTWNAGQGDDTLLGAATAGLRAPAIGAQTWSLTGLNIGVAQGGRRFFATVSVAPNALPGRTLLLALPAPDGVVVASGNSGPTDHTTPASGELTVVPAPSIVVASARSQTSRTLRPGATPESVFELVLHNVSASAETLLAVTIDNATLGGASASIADLDADWQPLVLARNRDDTIDALEPGEPTLRASATFVDGKAMFSLLQPIAAGDSVAFEVLGGASLAARDGDVLDLRVAHDSSFSFLGNVAVTGSFPLSPSGSYPVDGLVAAQITFGPVTPTLLTGDDRRLSLDALLPPNGYEGDVLTRLDVVNLGTAEAFTDLERLEAWADDGDGSFAPSLDRNLGELAYTGQRWEITGLAESVPAGVGLRVFVTVDVAVLGVAGHTVALAFPGPPDLALGMASANDGPIDKSAGAAAQTITTVDRVTLTPGGIFPGTVRPGNVDVAFLEISAANSYGDPRTLTSLRVRDATTGSGSVAELDAEFHRLVLRADDGDGVAEVAADSVLGLAFFQDGEAVFSGLDFALAAGETRRLFVRGDVSTPFAADDDVLAVEASSSDDVSFLEPTAIAAGWPLDSGARWTVDGMVAAQLRLGVTPTATLGPNEGPALALDITVPSRGYSPDILERLSVANRGTATIADLAEIRLWRDGGDGSFDAGSSDDVDLGALAPFNGEWTHPALGEVLPAGGARFFVGVSASASPGDSTTVRLAVPLGGLQVDSGDDGPIDVEVASENVILLSTAVLLASLEIDPAASTIDSTVAVTMTVRNVHPSLPVENVAPSALAAAGLGVLQLVNGPTPASRTLAPDESGTFSWTYRATSSGDVRLSGWAEGTEQGTGAPHRSLTVVSNEHRVFLQAQDLDLYAVESMPFSISRGQTGVVPISLTFQNPSGPGGSDVRVTGLRIRIEDEAGADVVPADLLSRVVVSEGGLVYVERTSLETSGADVDLAFAQPLVVQSAGASSQATVAIAFDLSDSTAVPTFRVKLVDASWVAAEDATSGGPVVVTLRQPDAFPVASGLARVVAEALRLDVDALPFTDLTAGRGQASVPLLTLTLDNPDPTGLAADVRIPTFEVRLVDSTGSAIMTPRDWIDALRVDSGPIVHLDRTLTAFDDSTISLVFAPLVSVPVNTPVTLRLTADVGATAPLGRVRLAVADSASFDARDANTGTRVPVVFATNPLAGPWTTVQARADSLAALAVPLMPPVVDVGSVDVAAMQVVLSHVATPGTASVRVESLALQCREASGAPLSPAAYLDRVRVLRAGTEIGLVTNLPTSGDVLVPLSGVSVDAGGSVTLDVLFDAEITAPPSRLGLSVPTGGIVARDANLDTAVTVRAPAGGFPLLSGFAQLRLPAREVLAGFEDRMPPVLAADDRPMNVAMLSLRNPAPLTAGDVRVAALAVRAADRDLTSLDLGAAVSSVTIRVAGEIWASSGDLEPTIASAALVGADTLVIAPGETVAIELDVALRAGANVPSLRIGLDAGDVGVVQPPGGLLSVAVAAEPGQSMPFWTEVGNFSGTSLAESWSNFPNPFAAGREGTTLVFYLPRSGRVSLKLWTLRGEEVRTLLESAPLAAGLHQDESWDGRNGRGEVVRNGVYLAEIAVSYDDGTSELLRRKVAVLR